MHGHKISKYWENETKRLDWYSVATDLQFVKKKKNHYLWRTVKWSKIKWGIPVFIWIVISSLKQKHGINLIGFFWSFHLVTLGILPGLPIWCPLLCISYMHLYAFLHMYTHSLIDIQLFFLLSSFCLILSPSPLSEFTRAWEEQRT